MGLVVAALCGATMGCWCLLTVPLGLSQHVSGLGITLFASALAYYLWPAGTGDLLPTIEPFRAQEIPVLSDIPILGPVLFSQTVPTYLALVAVAIMAYLLTRSPLGLAIRMTENPHAVEAQGLNPIRIRIGAVVAGSALMAGVSTMAAFDSFFPGMVQGRLDLHRARCVCVLASGQGIAGGIAVCVF